MPKHNSQRLTSDEDEIEKVYISTVLGVKAVEEINVPKPTTVSIRLRIDATYKVTGKNSGQSYLFKGAGSAQDVDERDVEWILSLRRNKSCCGGGGGNAIFELAGE